MAMTFKKGLHASAFAAMAMVGGAAQAQDMVFGYIPNSMSFPYNIALTDGFCANAEAKGVKCVILDSKMSMETQANQFDDLLAQGVNAIGFMPNDSVAVQALIDKAAEAGIPVAATSVFVGDPKTQAPDWVYPNLTALVNTDDTEAGRIAGKYAASKLPKDREVKVAVLEGAPGFAVNDQRQAGFEEVMKAEGINYTIVATQATDWTPESGESICQNMLTANPDIDLIFSHADQMALGCIRSIESAGSKALIVDASGGSTLATDAVKAGELDMSACNQPMLLGQLTFDVLYQAVQDGANAKKGQFIGYPMLAVTADAPDTCPAW